MADLISSSIAEGSPIEASQITDLYDALTGTTTYDNINLKYTASHASSASYAATSTTSSFSFTASYAENAGGATVDTGSLLTTASFSNPNLTLTKGDASTFNIPLTSLVPTSASYAVSSSRALAANSATTAASATSAVSINPAYAEIQSNPGAVAEGFAKVFMGYGAFTGNTFTTARFDQLNGLILGENVFVTIHPYNASGTVPFIGVTLSNGEFTFTAENPPGIGDGTRFTWIATSFTP